MDINYEINDVIKLLDKEEAINAFFERFKAVCRCVVDEDDVEGGTFGVLNPNLLFDTNNGLYVERKDKIEKKIIDGIKDTNKLVCCVGQRGCGKSTSIQKIIRDIDTSKSMYVNIYINMRKRKSYSDYTEEEKKVYIKNFDYFLRNKVMECINKYENKDLRISEKDILKWLFFYNKRSSYTFNTKNDDYEFIDSNTIDEGYDLFEKINSLHNNQSIVHPISEDDFIEDWIKRKNERSKTFVYQNFYLVHLLEAIQSILRDRVQKSSNEEVNFKIILWVDNIDHIGNYKERETIATYCDEMQSIAETYSRIVISIRDENIIRRKSPEGHGIQYIPFSKRKNSNLFIISKDHDIINNVIKDIVLRRLKLTIQMPDLLKRALSKTDYERKQNSLKEEISRWTIDLNKDTIEIIEKTIDRFFDSLAKPLLRISNNSIRDFLFSITGLIEYLTQIFITTSSYKDIIDDKKYNIKRDEIKSYINTLFFAWMRINIDHIKIPSIDVIYTLEQYKKAEDNGSFINGCTIRYLILNSVINETNINKEDYRYPTISSIIEKLSYFGYNVKIILKEILNLSKYSIDNRSYENASSSNTLRLNHNDYKKTLGRMNEILKGSSDSSWEQIVKQSKEDDQYFIQDFFNIELYTTYQSTELIKRICFSYGYLLASIMLSSFNEKLKQPIDFNKYSIIEIDYFNKLSIVQYTKDKQDKYFTYLYKYMNDIEKMHCETLKKWQKNMNNKIHGSELLQYYYKNFGIELDTQDDINKITFINGEKYQSIGYRETTYEVGHSYERIWFIMFDNLSYSLLRFYNEDNYPESHNKLLELNKKFKSSIKEILL